MALDARRPAVRSIARWPTARPVAPRRGARHPGDHRQQHDGRPALVSVERGHDPRDFTLVPFGGAGPLHGCSLGGVAGHHPRSGAPRARRAVRRGAAGGGPESRVLRTLAGLVEATDAIDAAFAALEHDAQAWLDEEHVRPRRPPDRPRRTDALRRPGRRVGRSLAGKPGRRPGRVRRRPPAAQWLRVGKPGGTGHAAGGGGGARSAAGPDGRGAGCGAAKLDARMSGSAMATPCRPASTSVPGWACMTAWPVPRSLRRLDATTLVPPGWAAEVAASGSLLLTRIV